DRAGLSASGEGQAMMHSVTSGLRPGRPALVHARRIGPTLLTLASAIAPPGWARAEDRPRPRVAQATPAHHDMQTRDAPGRTTPSELPAALPDVAAAPLAAPPNAGGAATPSQPLPGLADFERLALARNPTLRQAFAQFEA